ncbi:galactoside O-acetyltransferase [Companilactobacillus kimchiensis]|uniref:Galactoside O-acetyltransferase n=2 Tax=Companilactobacillus kimchiensis TaxID=993692 RepID=A0A0R2LH34_9LACO|nr:serine acetyltransferase [Companilactobacillus kimchiensis]KRO00743.1 galactoside O-acetyltransferase [Companilactobacillus kimchiensis]
MDFQMLLQQNCFSKDAVKRQQAAEILEKDYGCEINCLEMDETVRFAHHGRNCIVIASKLSKGVVIFQNVTIGSNQKFNKKTNQWENLGNPVIGRNVVIADGAKILGPIIIGDNSTVAAGAIVTKDVPANSIVYGVNQVRPRDANYDLIFHDSMPSREKNIKGCQDVIERFKQF